MIIILVRKNTEAILCTKKYFMVFSRAMSPSIDIRGKNESIFSSRETQNIIIEFLLIAM